MFANMIGSRIDPVLQGTQSECGLACAVMILNACGIHASLSEIRRYYPASQRGTTIRALLQLFDDFQLCSRPLRVEPEDLHTIELPCIVHWDFDHYVTLERCGHRHAHIIDPKVGRRKVDWRAFSNHFTGIALEVKRIDARRSAVAATKPSLFALLAGIDSRIGRLLASLLLLTLGVNCLALMLPLLLKFTFDRVVPSSDLALMQQAIIAFLLIAGLQFGVQAIRANGLANFRRGVAEHLSDSFFANLIWSRSAFFESRNAGTILAQYRSINAITSTVSELLISRVIDGLAVLVGTAIAFFFSLKVGLAILLTVAAHAFIFWLMQGELKSRLCQAIHADAKENAFFIETVSSIQTVKLYSRELLRLSAWKNIRETVESSLSSYGVYKANMYSALDLVTSTGWILTVYALVIDLQRDAVTLGTFTALVSWSTFIIQKFKEITQAASEVESLEEHVVRVEDVIAAEKEDLPQAPGESDETPTYDLRRTPLMLVSVSFRYDRHGPWLLERCDLTVEPGKMTVIRGDSGVGKTTLLKLTLGLITATDGTLLVGGRQLTPAEIARLRRHAAAVMQQDTVFAGSIRDNISFFDVTPDEELVERCAQMACIAEMIRELPMRYDSLVGHDGAGFSAGQIQRLTLARALYRKPELLVLDEFTSNLDERIEAEIIRNLKRAGMSILTTAHRATVIAAADHLFELKTAKLVRVT